MPRVKVRRCSRKIQVSIKYQGHILNNVKGSDLCIYTHTNVLYDKSIYDAHDKNTCVTTLNIHT